MSAHTFQQHGIDTSMWEPINMKGQDGIITQPLSKEEIRRLRDDLESKE